MDTDVDRSVVDWLMEGDPVATSSSTTASISRTAPVPWRSAAAHDSAYPGRQWFAIEPPGPSRWNTARVLRVLRWWEE
jgi:hypothetical protein